MRYLLLAGAAALALATPALAQQAEPPADAPPADASQLDSLVPADEPAQVAAPKPTGDPVLDRLNALEARVNQLEAENAELKQQAELSEAPVGRRAVGRADVRQRPRGSDHPEQIAGPQPRRQDGGHAGILGGRRPGGNRIAAQSRCAKGAGKRVGWPFGRSGPFANHGLGCVVRRD